eukprot:m.152643 g.152643  ORF g.152643 m.152643 type:complete len:75 (+) comp15055_c0_seq17:1119-1343(+)
MTLWQANHSSCPNSELEFCRHPRFGDIKCIVTLHEIDEDEEITIDYGYGDFKHRKGPKWFQELQKMETLQKMSK